MGLDHVTINSLQNSCCERWAQAKNWDLSWPFAKPQKLHTARERKHWPGQANSACGMPPGLQPPSPTCQTQIATISNSHPLRKQESFAKRLKKEVPIYRDCSLSPICSSFMVMTTIHSSPCLHHFWTPYHYKLAFLSPFCKWGYRSSRLICPNGKVSQF